MDSKINSYEEFAAEYDEMVAAREEAGIEREPVIPHFLKILGDVSCLITFLLGLLLVSCSQSAPYSRHMSAGTPQVFSQAGLTPINRPVPTTGCGRASPVAPGTSVNQTIPAHLAQSRGMSTRTYRVHVPTGYNQNQPLAVVLVFHGHGGTAVGIETSTGFSALADQQDFIAVYPQGLLGADDNQPFWASVGPIDFGIDDVLFVSDVLNDLQARFCVDLHRIYATGFSNGGGMSFFLACRLAGRIAAIAPASGNFYAPPGGCQPGRPVPILDFHGTNDPILPYTGIPSSVNPQWPLPSIQQWLQEWASRNGCINGPVIFLHETHVTGEQWTNCHSNASVVHYRIEGGGHAWPPAIDGHTAAEVIWFFFQAHPLP